MKPVLVFIFSKSCGACVNFKRKVLPDLESELAGDNRFNLVILDFPEMQIASSNHAVGTYHPELRNYVKFFPTIAIFPGNLWNDHRIKLKGIAKHGDENPPRVDYSKLSILNWINQSLQNEMFATVPSSGPKSSNNYVVPTYGQIKFKSARIDETE